MIACRSLFRIERYWKLSNKHISPKPVRFSQQCFLHGLNHKWSLGGVTDRQLLMDRKKRKPVAAIWRPVSSQSSSYDVVKDVKVEYEHVPNEDGGSISGGISNIVHSHEGTEVVSESAEQPICTGEQQDNIGSRVLEEETVNTPEKHSLSLNVGTSLMRFIKGKDGSTQKRIEEEMGVKIIFPSSKDEDSILIEGDSVESVHGASERLQIIVDEAVKSPRLDYSHFISLPLAIHSELVDKLVDFQNCILGITDSNQDENCHSDSNGGSSEDEDKDVHVDSAPGVGMKATPGDDYEHDKVDVTNIPIVCYQPKASKSSDLSADQKNKSASLSGLGIEKSIFIKPKTFHLTVLMLKLWNKDRVVAAAEVLQSVSSKVIDALDHRPVAVRLKGLECMKGSLAKARVLYARVEEIDNEDRLVRACQVITDAFIEAGLVLERDAQQKLKLHATVMNARHRKSRKKGTRKLDFFDARNISKQYGNEEWGEYPIPEIHLSQRFAYDESGYYRRITSIPLPESMHLE